MNYKPIFWSGIIVALDQLLKYYIRNTLAMGQSIPIIPDFFHITHTVNKGIGFGLLQNTVPFIILVSLMVITILIYHFKEFPNKLITNAGFALILGGAIGNLIDRIYFGYVTDFLDFRIWPVFNLADFAVTAGAILLLVWLWK